MIITNPQSINDLVTLNENGIPVTLTSHPGNASLYKSTLWACGVPEHFWDVTCCKADRNNWPMHRLKNGIAELLVDEAMFDRICAETNRENRFVTAYQFTKDGERLGRSHVRPVQEMFPDVISSCSRLLLSQQKFVLEMFEFLAETRNDVFTRFITPDGIMRPITQSGILRSEYASSFMNVLHELDHLLLSDEYISTKGGACYDGVSVALSGMLAHYWATGEIVRVDVSGPDMIKYAMKEEFIKRLRELLEHLRTWRPELIPKYIFDQMFPGTYARVGCISNHFSEEIMERKKLALCEGNRLLKEQKKALQEAAKDDNTLWPIEIKPEKEVYFSQYDLIDQGGELLVDEYWKNQPIKELRPKLQMANQFLRIR